MSYESGTVRWFGWSVIVLLVPGAAAQSFDLEASFASPSSVELADSTELELAVLGAHLTEPGASWSITGEELDLRLYNSPLERVITEPGGPVPTATARGRDMETELLRHWKHSGSISYAAPNGAPWINWQSNRVTDVSFPPGPARIQSPDSFGWATSLTDERNRPGLDADKLGAGAITGFGAFSTTSNAVTVNVTGTQVFYNAFLQIGSETVETGWRVNESRSPAHVEGVGGHYVYDRVFLIITGDFTYHGNGSIHYAATKAEHNGPVDVLFRDAAGTYQVDGHEYELAGDVLQAIGDLELAAEFEEETVWSLGGTGVFVGVNTITVHGSRSADIPAAVAAVATAGIAVLLWKLVPRIAVLWSRDAWGNEDRARIGQLITWNPGITLSDISRRVRKPRKTVAWHVEFLERKGKVSRFRGRRVPSFALNSDSSKFRVGSREVEADEVFHLLQHDVRRQILEAAASGVDYQCFRRFQEARGEAPVSQRVFSGHAKQMTEAGLLERRVRDGRAKWSALVDYANLRRDCIRRYLTRPNPWRWKIYDALQESQSRRQLQRSLGMGDMRDLDALLTELRALGLVRNAGGQWHAVPF